MPNPFFPTKNDAKRYIWWSRFFPWRRRCHCCCICFHINTDVFRLKDQIVHHSHAVARLRVWDYITPFTVDYSVRKSSSLSVDGSTCSPIGIQSHKTVISMQIKTPEIFEPAMYCSIYLSSIFLGLHFFSSLLLFSVRCLGVAHLKCRAYWID